MTYDLISLKNYTRVIIAPDGGSHLVTMPGWYWNALAWMDEATEWSEFGFIGTAFDTAKKMEQNGTMMHPDNFHAEFSEAFRIHIWHRLKVIDYQQRGIANEPRIGTY